MNDRKKIAILIHENDRGFFTYPPFIMLLKREWETYGFSVEVVRGIRNPIDADVVIPHIDLTIRPDEYRELIDRHPHVVNRNVVDISRSKFSANILERDESFTGPVIVKTDRNHGGLPEKRLAATTNTYVVLSRLHAEKILFMLHRLGFWNRLDYLDPHNYPVFNSLQEVPREVFDNRNLIVEKFLPEIDKGYYCLRRWIFLGDKGVNVISKSKERIIKPLNTISIEEAPVPEELYQIRQSLCFDYGKFDYVLRDGKVVLFDINRTLASGGNKPSAFAFNCARTVAEGIWSFL